MIIFDLTRHDYNYKGVLFAEMDTEAALTEMGMTPLQKDYCAGIMGLIWTDEKGQWHGKLCIKFPSGNKQVIICNFEDEFKNGVKINETYVLNHFYKLPMIRKTWTKNHKGTIDGILKIIENLDMIESVEIVNRLINLEE